MNWHHVHGVPRLHPIAAGLGSSTPHDEWMDGWDWRNALPQISHKLAGKNSRHCGGASVFVFSLNSEELITYQTPWE